MLLPASMPQGRKYSAFRLTLKQSEIAMQIEAMHLCAAGAPQVVARPARRKAGVALAHDPGVGAAWRKEHARLHAAPTS